MIGAPGRPRARSPGPDVPTGGGPKPGEPGVDRAPLGHAAGARPTGVPPRERAPPVTRIRWAIRNPFSAGPPGQPEHNGRAPGATAIWFGPLGAWHQGAGPNRDRGPVDRGTVPGSRETPPWPLDPLWRGYRREGSRPGRARASAR